MDMKRILQALDTASTQPVEGANSMSKFLRIVKEAELNQPVQETEQVPAMPDVSGIQPGQSKDLGDGAKVTVNTDGTVSYQGGWGTYVYNAQGQHVKTQSPSFAGYNQTTDAAGQVTQQNYTAGPMSVQQGPQGTQASYQLGDQNLTTPISEGANPHKVALPVQMAMNHYQSPKEHPTKAPSLLRKYFAEAEEEVTQAESDRKERLRMYSQKIAERVLVKEGLFDSKPKVDWNKRAKELFAKGMNEQQVAQQLLKEGCPPNQVNVYVQAGQLEETPIDMTGDPNDPVVYGHEKANPMSLKGRIVQARNQLKELAQLADSNDLIAWEKITRLAKGGMFMGLEQNLEQIRHGIEQLAAKRKQGGVASRGIDKNIGEVGVVDSVANKLVSAGASARKAVDTAINSIPRPFDEKEVANDLQKQKRQS
jgi:hypothetical protein